jgi:LPXTG-site transpeptidase (sortase) family protein
MTRPRPAVLVMALSAIALIIAIAVIASTGSGSSVASVGERPSAPATPTQTSADIPPDAGQSTPAPESSLVRSRVRLDATELPARDLGAAPASIRIPRLDVEAIVDEVGLLGEGLVEVPQDVERTGWYRYSQVTGNTEGASVIVGHRDGVTQGRGAFYDLGELTPGDRVVVTTRSGDRVRYEVVSRESFDKQIVPLEELFSSAGTARLTLITCGGPFDATTLGYTDNVVVTAVAIDGAEPGGTP